MNALHVISPRRSSRVDSLSRTLAYPGMAISEQNAYKCAKCKRNVTAKKSTRLYDAPMNLTLSLKRYCYGRFGGRRQKVRPLMLLTCGQCVCGVSGWSLCEIRERARSF